MSRCSDTPATCAAVISWSFVSFCTVHIAASSAENGPSLAKMNGMLIA